MSFGQGSPNFCINLNSSHSPAPYTLYTLHSSVKGHPFFIYNLLKERSKVFLKEFCAFQYPPLPQHFTAGPVFITCGGIQKEKWTWEDGAREVWSRSLLSYGVKKVIILQPWFLEPNPIASINTRTAIGIMSSACKIMPSQCLPRTPSIGLYSNDQLMSMCTHMYRHSQMK